MDDVRERNGQAAGKPWTFLTNHALVLLFLAKHSRITARELAQEVGITERAVRSIIADLETAGYIGKTREGRQVKYDVHHGMPLRHKTQQDKAVGELLKMLGFSFASSDE